MLSFEGHLCHGGNPILSGTRYIIAGFLIIIPPEEATPSFEKQPSEVLTVITDVWNKKGNSGLTVSNASEVTVSNAADSSGFSFNFLDDSQS
jgi:hypothetical protein